MTFLGIIPARYASTRFPGKPLVKIGDKTMIERVYTQVKKALHHVYVATDDHRIFDTVLKFGGKAVLTSANHQSGTDRCKEAWQHISKETGNTYDIIVNIQGDEPFIDPAQILLLKELFNDEQTQIGTLITPIKSHVDLFDYNKVKAVKDLSGFALYFSRQPIPYQRNADENVWHEKHTYYKHLGIYAFRTQVLKEITALSQSSLEVTESLEQNRWLENGYKIKTALTSLEGIAIDTPEDLEKARNFLLSLK